MNSACLLPWLQGHDSNPGAIVGIQCLVKDLHRTFEVHRLEPGSSGRQLNVREKDSCRKL